MQWMVPRPRLGDEQNAVLDACLRGSGPQWIQGFAGSGKSVILVHLMHQVLAIDPTARVCFVTFTHALKDLARTGLRDEFSDLPVMTYPAFLKDRQHYDYIFVDEIQDLPGHVIDLLVWHAGRIYFAGDMDQSIYDDGASGEEIIRVASPKLHELKVLYRLTGKVRDIACAVLPGATIENAALSRLVEVQPVLANAADTDTEFTWVLAQAKCFAEQGNPTLVLLPTHDRIYDFIAAACRSEGAVVPPRPTQFNGRRDYEDVNQRLFETRVPLVYLGNGYGSLQDSDTRPLTYVMTYHSSKGLDFRTVFLPSLNAGTRLWRDPDRERRLFFVGITRSWKDLFLSYSGSRPHHLIENIPSDLLMKIECKLDDDSSEDEDFLF